MEMINFGAIKLQLNHCSGVDTTDSLRTQNRVHHYNNPTKVASNLSSYHTTIAAQLQLHHAADLSTRAIVMK